MIGGTRKEEQVDTIRLDRIEQGDKIRRLIRLLPAIEELCEKYEKSKAKYEKHVTRRETESRFIRSFRRRD